MINPVRFFLDQHIDPAVAVGLRRHNVDVLTAREAGRCGLDDAAQLQFATTQSRVVVTSDTDFLVMHRSGVTHAGIAWAPAQKATVRYWLQGLLLIHAAATADDMLNRVEYL